VPCMGEEGGANACKSGVAHNVRMHSRVLASLAVSRPSSVPCHTCNGMGQGAMACKRCFQGTDTECGNWTCLQASHAC